MRNEPQIRRKTSRRQTRGFSLIEMMLATVILLVGLVGIAQLVPTSILINQRGRLDSTSLVFAQKELDQMLAQPLYATSFSESNGALCAVSCDLGDPAHHDVAWGSSLVWVAGRPLMDFSVAPYPNYSFSYLPPDPNDPFALTYDVRWAVVTTVKPGTTIVVGKRFIVGVRQLGGSNFVPAVTLDAMVKQ